MFNYAFASVFAEPAPIGKGWTHPGVVNLTFISIAVGQTLGLCTMPLAERAYRKRVQANGGKSTPEARVIPALYMTWLLPIGLFIFAWTSYPRLPWIAPLVGSTLYGMGFFSTIFAVLAYTSDSYGHYTSSALGATVFVRNTVSLYALGGVACMLKLS